MVKAGWQPVQFPPALEGVMLN